MTDSPRQPLIGEGIAELHARISGIATWIPARRACPVCHKGLLDYTMLSSGSYGGTIPSVYVWRCGLCGHDEVEDKQALVFPTSPQPEVPRPSDNSPDGIYHHEINASAVSMLIDGFRIEEVYSPWLRVTKEQAEERVKARYDDMCKFRAMVIDKHVKASKPRTRDQLVDAAASTAQSFLCEFVQAFLGGQETAWDRLSMSGRNNVREQVEHCLSREATAESLYEVVTSYKKGLLPWNGIPGSRRHLWQAMLRVHRSIAESLGLEPAIDEDAPDQSP